MTRSILLLLVLVAILMCAVGVLVGQQIQRSKFDNYLRSAQVTTMQLALLEANMEIIRDSVPTNGVGVPTVDYDSSCRCFVASATVFNAGDFMKKPFAEVNNTLMGSVIVARTNLKREFPEMSEWKPDVPDQDFKMTFTQFVFGPKIERKVLAEYSNGKLSFK